MFTTMTDLHTHHYQSQRLETLGLMTSGIVHDFNNLLTSIMGQASLALLKLPPGSDARLHVEKTIKAAQYASVLTRHLLSFSSGDHTKPETIDINALIQDNVGLIDVILHQGITLHLELTPHLPAIEARRAEIQQVLMNLMINAVEAIHTLPGRILVRTDRYEASGSAGYKFISKKEPLTGCYVMIEVSDSGCGMDEETLSHIFDPFFTTKTNGKGLGLSAVLEIIESCNGNIAIQSHPCHGTTFSIFLPLAASDPNN